MWGLGRSSCRIIQGHLITTAPNPLRRIPDAQSRILQKQYEEAALEAKATSELLPQHFFWSNHLINARNCWQWNYSEPSLLTSCLLLAVATCSNAQDVGRMKADYAVNYFVIRRKCNHSGQFYLDAFLPLSIWAAIPGTQVKVGKLLVGRWTTPLHVKQPQLQFWFPRDKR